MNEQKQVEKIAKIMLNDGLKEEKIFSSNVFREGLYSMYIEDAKHLYNEGCRIINENDVLIKK